MELVDLPAFGRPVRLVWHKRRWRCARRGCSAGAVTEQDPAIAPVRERLTARAGRWATRQAGRGRPVKDVASELGCSWHPVNTSVRRWGGGLIDADTARISDVFALGLDETLMWRRGRFRTKAWSTGIVDVASGQMLVAASERITDDGRTKLRGLLDAGDPYGEVRDAWRAKETLRSIYDIDDANLGAATVNQLAADLQDPAMPPEINRLGRTIWRWGAQISNWHAARVTNAPTEAAILWSVSEGVVDVADGHVAGCRGRVIWSVSLASAMLLAV